MSLNAAALRLLADKGLSALDIAEVAEAMEVRRDPTAAARQQRRRDKVKATPDRAMRDGVTRDVTPNHPPNDLYSNPPDPQSSDDDCPPLPAQLAERLVTVWNEAAAKSGLAPARGLDAGRKAAVKARAREHGEAALFDAVRNLAASKFHCGGNDRGWRATLGWLLKSPENFLKALELPAPGDAVSEQMPGRMDQAAWNAFCDRNVELFRRMRREDDALDWERRKRGLPRLHIAA